MHLLSHALIWLAGLENDIQKVKYLINIAILIESRVSLFLSFVYVKVDSYHIVQASPVDYSDATFLSVT